MYIYNKKRKKRVESPLAGTVMLFDHADAHTSHVSVAFSILPMTALRCACMRPPDRLSQRYLAFVRRNRSSSRSDCSKNKASSMSSVERDQLGQRGSGDSLCAGLLRGLDHIRDPQLNKVCYSASHNKCVCYSHRKIIAIRHVDYSHHYYLRSGRQSRFNCEARNKRGGRICY